MKKKFRLTIPSQTKKLKELSDFIIHTLTPYLHNKEAMDEMIISVDEVATNIIIHAYKSDSSKYIRTEIEIEDNRISVVLFNDGITFNPDAIQPPNLNAPPADRESGGLGLYIVKKFMDEVEYSFKGPSRKENTVRLTKHCITEL